MGENSDRSKIGFVYWVAQMGLIFVIAGVLHLSVLPLETVFNLVIFALLGVMLTLISIAARGGQFISVPFSTKTAIATVAGFLGLVLLNLGLWFFFDAPLFSSFASGGDWFERALVNILAAICEEDLMFGAYCVGKAAFLPDIWIVLLSTLVFAALHALVYNLYSLDVIIFLAVGRLVFTGLYAVTDHSDPSFIIHILWNVINT